MEALKMTLFSLAVIGFFTWFSNYIPQIESHPPKKITLATPLTAEEMIEAGETVYSTQGTCGICHAIGRPGNRGPDLAGISLRAASRSPGLDATAYLLESLLKPGAYIVEGYGPLMPPMGAILTPGELMVVVAYLQSLDGEVTITPDAVQSALALHGVGAAPAPVVQSAPPAPQGGKSPAAKASTALAAVGDAKAGAEVFMTNCAPCHGPNPALDGPVGPSIQGASTELIEARLVSAGYPAGYQPKRNTKLMPPMPHLKDQTGNLATFLRQ